MILAMQHFNITYNEFAEQKFKALKLCIQEMYIFAHRIGMNGYMCACIVHVYIYILFLNIYLFYAYDYFEFIYVYALRVLLVSMKYRRGY